MWLLLAQGCCIPSPAKSYRGTYDNQEGCLSGTSAVELLPTSTGHYEGEYRFSSTGGDWARYRIEARDLPGNGLYIKQLALIDSDDAGGSWCHGEMNLLRTEKDITPGPLKQLFRMLGREVESRLSLRAEGLEGTWTARDCNCHGIVTLWEL